VIRVSSIWETSFPHFTPENASITQREKTVLAWPRDTDGPPADNIASTVLGISGNQQRTRSTKGKTLHYIRVI